jgi:DNA mismatch repair ATPase MutS
MEEKMELLEQVQAVYPFFHTFKENFDSEIEDIPEFTDEDREKVETDITKLSQKEVADYLYRIENKGQPSEEDLDDFMSMTTHEEREYYLTIHLQENNTHVVSIQNMLKM